MPYVVFAFDSVNSLLPGLKLEWPIFTMALPMPGHERVKVHKIGILGGHIK